MAVSAPAKDMKKAGPAPLVPPDEKFWKRYSPHGEAPLSMAGSIAVHALAIGMLILGGIFFGAWLLGGDRSLPIEPVRLDLGGGGGKPTGVGDGKGIGEDPKDIVGKKGEKPQPGEENAEKRPSLEPVDVKKLEEKYDSDSVRRINKSKTGQVIAQLEGDIQKQLRQSVNPGYGRGGPGSGGGKGTGKGTGEGAGTGEGKSTLSKREKRMLRWHMKFTANSGPEYLAQLRGLGAILAFPVSSGDKVQYKVLLNRDLKPGGKLVDEDISKLNRIYWFDDNPRSVFDILTTLGLRLNPVPGRFVAFMPEDLEKQLFNMERQYVEKTLRRNYEGEEDNIEETVFSVIHVRGSYRPELMKVTMK